MTSVRELLLMHDAERVAKRTPEDRRLAVEAGLARVRQRGEAADVLWANGHTAEGLRLAGGALEEALALVDRLYDAPTDDGREAQLAAAGLASELAVAVAKAEAADREAEAPALDRDVSAADAARYRRLAVARRHLDGWLAPATRTPAEVARTRILRLGGLLLALVGLAAAAYAALAPASGVSATASGTWSPTQGLASFAIDDDPETEWQLPNRTEGWLEVTISPPERIETLHLLNGHNGGYNDRAIRSATIEVRAGGSVARTFTQEWPAVVPRPEWVDLAVGVDDVESVRVTVDAYHREGAALAELDWD